MQPHLLLLLLQMLLGSLPCAASRRCSSCPGLLGRLYRTLPLGRLLLLLPLAGALKVPRGALPSRLGKRRLGGRLLLLPVRTLLLLLLLAALVVLSFSSLQLGHLGPCMIQLLDGLLQNACTALMRTDIVQLEGMKPVQQISAVAGRPRLQPTMTTSAPQPGT